MVPLVFIIAVVALIIALEDQATIRALRGQCYIWYEHFDEALRENCELRADLNRQLKVKDYWKNTAVSTAKEH